MNFFGDFFGTLDLSGLEILKFFHPVRCFVVKYFYEVFSFMRGNRRCLFGCAYVCMRGLLTMEFFPFFSPFQLEEKLEALLLISCDRCVNLFSSGTKDAEEDVVYLDEIWRRIFELDGIEIDMIK